jgi:hypothetical protein
MIEESSENYNTQNSKTLHFFNRTSEQFSHPVNCMHKSNKFTALFFFTVSYGFSSVFLLTLSDDVLEIYAISLS